MKRLLLVALMVLVSLVGLVGLSRAAKAPATQSVTPVIGDIQLSLDAISNDQINVVSALQASANPTTGALTELLEPVNAGVPARAKMYYLTKNSFDGGDAIKSCDPRFHMASLFELQGTPELQYAMSLSSAYVPANDEVSGTHIRPGDGWARPGFSAALPADRIPDLGDCEHWTTRSLDVSGTTVQSPIPSYDPNKYYDDPITNTVRDRWLSYSETSCMANLRVWCVEDPE
jgi:hypothetical protein